MGGGLDQKEPLREGAPGFQADLRAPMAGA